MLCVEHAQHFVFVDGQNGSRYVRGSRALADQLTRHAALAKKIARTKHGHHRFPARPIHDGESYGTFLNVHDAIRGVALREDPLGSPKSGNLSRHPRGVEKCM